MSSLDHVGYWATKHSVAVFQTSRDFIIAEGPDTLEYLQGQLTQDIAALAPGGSTWSFLLEPDGKVNALLRVTRLEPFDARIGEDGVNVERVILDFDSGFVDQVLSRLNRFKLRTSVEFLELNWECLSLRGPLSEEKLHEIGKVGDFTVVRYLAGGLFGFDLLGEHFDVPPSLSWCGKDDYEALLVETGAVRMGKEIDKRTIPQEIGDVHFAVSFNKGCYTGQELMARLDARGNNVARRLRGVVFEAVPSPAPSSASTAHHLMPKAGTTLWMYDSSGNESQVGELTSVAWSPAISSPIALAYLHRSVVLSAEVFVRLDNVPSNADNTLKYDRREAVKMRGVVEQLPMGCATGKGINQGA